MTNTKNILVFPCGSEVGLEIYQSVRYSRFFHLIGASSADDHGKFVFSDYIGGVPFVGDPDFISVMAGIVSDRQIDAIVPAMDSAIVALKEHEAELGCMVIAPPAETCRMCLSKGSTYKALSGIVPLPKDYTHMPPESLPYPVFAKPDVGYGSRGAKCVYSKSELEAHLSENPDCLVLEYLSGQEYTIDCFTDRQGRLLYAAGRTRARIRNGISVRTEFPFDQVGFESFASRVNDAIAMRGAWFVQVKRDGAGELRLMEVAARIAGSSALTRSRGINLAQLSLFDAFGLDVEIQTNAYGTVLDRALANKYLLDIDYNCVYVDYDDCLVFEDGTINENLVAFVYQCVNDGVEVVLLTRHEGDLNDALLKHRLAGLFDRIVHIGRHELKSDNIDRLDSLFIDDSFSERADVHTRLGIPVFAPDMVECLKR